MTDAEAYDQLYEAMVRGDAGEFERLLAEHPRMRRYDDGRDRWLGEAATEGSLPVIQLLVRLGTDVNEPANNDSVACPEGVIYRAAEMGHLEVVRWLLDRGAKVNHVVAGQTRCYALSGAARGGYLEVVKLLVERGAAVNACWAGLTPRPRPGVQPGGGRCLPALYGWQTGRGTGPGRMRRV
jgi:hypothetical protein